MNAVRELLEQLLRGEDLSELQAGTLMQLLTEPELPGPLAGAVLAALRAKTMTADELRGFALGMRKLARRPQLPPGDALVDMVGPAAMAREA